MQQHFPLQLVNNNNSLSITLDKNNEYRNKKLDDLYIRSRNKRKSKI